MNINYSISSNPQKYDLKDLGQQVIHMIIGDHTSYRATTPGDYDDRFISLLKEQYSVSDIRDYLTHHMNNNSTKKEDYVDHIEYKILPILKKKNYGNITLIENWIQTNR
jgi:hypothetical protein